MNQATKEFMNHDQRLRDGKASVISVEFFAGVIKQVVIFFTVIILADNLQAAIVSVSIPEGSQNPLCRPSYDNIWKVTTPPFPFNTQEGIGLIVKPGLVLPNNNGDFALHQNDDIQPSPLYVASHIPNPESVTITYNFDHPQTIRGVEIIQHGDGVTRVEGFLGSCTNSLVSLGSVFGPAGDVTSGTVGSNGVSQIFDFGNTNVAGAVFQLVIRKTSYPAGFALHRAYPLTVNSNRVPIASGLPKLTIQFSQVQICWNSDGDKTYQVQYRSELTTNAWVDLGTPIAGTGTTSCITDPITGPRRFYQVVVLP